MPGEDNKILKYISGEKSLKVPFIIYSDLEWLLQKIKTCQNNSTRSYTERFCKDLRNQAMKIINYEKKKMIPLTKEEKESYEKQKACHICEEEFCTDKTKKEF